MEYITATYIVVSPDPKRVSIEKIARALADEQGLGLRGLSTEDLYYSKLQNLAIDILDIIEIRENIGLIKLGFPLDHFDLEIVDISNILNTIGGDAFNSRYIKYLKLIDIELPEELVRVFPGPKIGLEGIRKITGEKKLPLVGVIIKPSLGLKPEEVADIVHKAGLAGAHVIKDDEKFYSTKYSKFEKKLELISKNIDRVERETGNRILYALNISGDLRGLYKRAQMVDEYNLGAALITIVTMGIGTLRFLAEDQSIKIALYAHRTMHGTFTRHRFHGISMRVINKLSRLAGADFQHIGAVIGSHKESLPEVMVRYKYLVQKWYHLKPSFPVVSAGIHPGNVHANLHALKTYDIVFMVGRGIYFKSNDVGLGVRALKQAIKSYEEGLNIDEALKKYNELREAIKLFGYLEPRHEW